MVKNALGIIEAKGLTTAVACLDAAVKAADVTLIGVERVIGGPNAMAVVIHLAGEVAAVRSAVDAGVEAGKRVGTVIAGHVIPRPHDELEKLIKKFSENLKTSNKGSSQKSQKGKTKKDEKKSDKEE
jgi:ethanolamine utilization protein EutM